MSITACVARRRCSASSTTTSGPKNDEWNAIPVKGGELFDFDPKSTYIQEPPFFTTSAEGAAADQADHAARACW